MGGCMAARDVPAASLSMEDNMNRIEARFAKADSNGDGKLDLGEFTKMLPGLGLEVKDESETSKMLASIDANGDGVIDLKEFKAACYMAALRMPEAKIDELLVAVIKRMAATGKSKSLMAGGVNLKKVQTRTADGPIKESIESQIETKWSEIDKDMDGLIDLQEFQQSIQALNLNWSETKTERILREIGGKSINFVQFKQVLMAAASALPDADINTVFRTTLLNLSAKQAMNKGFLGNKVERMMSAVNSEFNKLDQNGDGKLDLAEFTKAIKEVFEFTWDDAKIKEILDKIDTDNSGTIERKEFTTVFRAAAETDPEQDIQELLSNTLLTMASKGGVGQQLLAGLPKLKKVDSPGEAKLVVSDDVMTKISLKFQELDLDNDGALNISEFSKALQELGLKWQIKTTRNVLMKLGNGSSELSSKQFQGVLGAACQANEDASVDAILKMTLMNMVNKASLNQSFNNEAIKKKTQALNDEFKKRDKDGSGSLDGREFLDACRAWGLKENEDVIKMLLGKIDTDKDGTISLKEFRRAFSIAVSKNPALGMEEAIKLTLESMATKGGLNAAFKGAAGQFNLKKGRTRVRSLEENTVSKIANKFKEMDKDGDGALSISEFAAGIQKLGLKWPDYKIRGTLRRMDKDGSGDISFSEFAQVLYAAVDAFPTKDISDLLATSLENVAGKSNLNSQFRENNQKQIMDKFEKKFEDLDENKDGQLDQAEFSKMVLKMGLNWSEEETIAALKKIDTDNSGTISKLEFRSALYMAAIRNADTGIDEIISAVLKRMMAQGGMNYQLGESFPELKKVEVKRAKAEEDSISRIEQAFYKIDLDRNGTLSAKELAVACTDLGLAWDEKMCEEVISEIDLDGTGQLNMFDFALVLGNAANRNPKASVEDLMKDALESQRRTMKMKAQMRANSLKAKLKAMEAKFKELDANNDGKLDLTEFSQAVKSFGLAWSDSEIKECLQKIDTDKSGTIERREFSTAFYSAAMKNPDLQVDEIIVAALNQMMNKGALNQSFATGFQEVANKLKKTTTRASAPFMTEGILSQIEAKFMSLDLDLDGQISTAEMSKALVDMGLKWDEEKVSGLIGRMTDGKDTIQFKEFKPVIMETANKHSDWTVDQVLRTALTNLANKSDVNRALRARSVSKE